MPIFLLQGFFFSQHSWFGLGMGSHGEGVVATINSGLCRFMYAGTIYPFPGKSGRLVGQMTDQFGESILSNVSVYQKELSFTKKYERREDLIDYNFVNQNGLWVGSYSGQAVGRGDTKCILTEVSEDIFQPPEKS